MLQLPEGVVMPVPTATSIRSSSMFMGTVGPKSSQTAGSGPAVGARPLAACGGGAGRMLCALPFVKHAQPAHFRHYHPSVHLSCRAVAALKRNQSVDFHRPKPGNGVLNPHLLRRDQAVSPHGGRAASGRRCRRSPAAPPPRAPTLSR